MKDNQFLYDYLNAFAPVGLETEGQSIWISEMRKYGVVKHIREKNYQLK